MADMLCAHIRGAEQPVKWRTLGRGLNRRTTLGFFPFHQADYSDYSHPGLARCFDCRDGGSAGGAYVVDDNHGRVRLLKAFDPAPSAVSLFRFPHQKTIQHRRAGSFQGMPGAGRRYVADDRVSAEGETAYRAGPQLVLAYEI